MKKLTIKKLLKKIKRKILGLYRGLSSSSNYGKFVVITRSRTGSNLLISLLNSHPQIDAFGEKFNRLGESDCKTIYNQIFPKTSAKTRGFKIFYYHPLDSEDKQIWDFLKNDSKIKIIHLQRANLLRTHISRLIAGKTDKWSSQGNNKVALENKKVQIDVNELLSDIKTTKNYIQKTQKAFKNHDLYEVSYQELVTNRANTMECIFNFLQVSKFAPKSDLKRQNPEPIKDIVLNYDEVYSKLVNTDYAFMLED